MRSKKVTYMLQAAMIAAIYVILVVLFNYWSFGPVQFRIAEILTILPYFTPAAVPGLFVGCVLANFLGGSILVDIALGSVATLIGAVGTYLLSKVKAKWLTWIITIPPILANALIVPFVLKYGYGTEEAIPLMMLTIGAGEIIVCGILGMILLCILRKYKGAIFKN